MNTRRLSFFAILSTGVALILTCIFRMQKQPSALEASYIPPQTGMHDVTELEQQEQTDSQVVEAAEKAQSGGLATIEPPPSQGNDQVTSSAPVPRVEELSPPPPRPADSHWTPRVDTRSRSPLILTSDDIDPDVHLLSGDNANGANLILKLPTKTPEEIQAISEQWGDIMYDGQLIKRGPSPGALLKGVGGTNIGLAFYYRTEEEAKAVVTLLRSASDKKK